MTKPEMNVAHSPEFTLVLPLRIDRSRVASDLDRFLALGLPSLERFLDRGMVQELIVISPHRDVAQVARALRHRSPFPTRIVDEDCLAPGISHVAGWVRQQILKLAAPREVTTDWYITLDADVVASRPLSRDFLLPEGRAIWQGERAGDHLEWWVASARALHLATDVDPQQRVFGVTPAVMHTDAVRSLTRRIEAIHPGRSWVTTLTSEIAGWTEYTLYWTHLVDEGLNQELYSSEIVNTPYTLEGSIWSKQDLVRKASRMKPFFDPTGPAGFIVFQSNMEVPLAYTVKILGPFVAPNQTVGLNDRFRWRRHWLRRAVVDGLRTVRRSSVRLIGR